MKKLFLTLVVAFATLCSFAQESITVEYPYYETINTRFFDISKVIADKEATVLEVYFYAVENITVDANIMLVGNTTGKHYKLLRSEGVEIGQATNLPESGFMKGVLHFEPLDKEDLSFDFDGGKSGWNLKGVSLKEYSLKEVIGKDKKWGKVTQSPFIGNYVHDSIRVECEIKNSNEPVVLFNPFGFEDRDCEFTDDFTYTFPVFNATCFYLKVGRKAYPVPAWPGDTVKVIYDGNNSVPEIMVSDTVLHKSIMEYYSYDRSNGIYDSPVSYNLSPLSLFYKYTEGTLKRHLIRLQKYIEEHPGFDERAAYFYRTNIKAEQLDAMWSMLRRRKLEETPEDLIMLVKELSTDIPNPLTLGRYTTYMLKSYVSYCDDNGLGVRMNWPDKAALLEQDRLGVINLSKKEKSILNEYEYLTSLKLALVMGKVGDTISAKKRVERLESVDKRYTQICEKYKVDTLPSWNKQNCMLIGDIMKTRRAVEDLHLPAEDCKYAISLLTYNQLATEEKSVNDTIISAAMEGLEDFAPAQVIVEQNNYLRRLEARELEVKYLRNHADLTPETLVADSLLATILEPHRGKVVYADFWGSWCGPCKEQLKHMQAVKDELKGKDVVYLYFANNTPEDVRQVVVKKLGLYGDNIFHYNLPDEQQESIERLLGVTKFPTFMLFDKNGKLVSSDAPFPQHLDALINEINKYLE